MVSLFKIVGSYRSAKSLSETRYWQVWFESIITCMTYFIMLMIFIFSFYWTSFQLYVSHKLVIGLWFSHFEETPFPLFMPHVPTSYITTPTVAAIVVSETACSKELKSLYGLLLVADSHTSSNDWCGSGLVPFHLYFKKSWQIKNNDWIWNLRLMKVMWLWTNF